MSTKVYTFLVLSIIILGIKNANGQAVTWVQNTTLEHDRSSDFKWWELYLNSTDSTHIQLHCDPLVIQTFMITDAQQDQMFQFTQQKSIALPEGQQHIYIFSKVLSHFSDTSSIQVIINQDTSYLYNTINIEKDQSNKHPTEGYNLKVFPKKSSGLFKIDMQPLRNAEVIVYDQLRSIVHETDWSGRLLDLRGLKAGKYTLQIDDLEFPVEIVDAPQQQYTTH